MIVEDGTIIAWFIDRLENLFDSKTTKIRIGEIEFSISASARRRIVRFAEAPHPNLRPCLFYALSYRVTDENGNEFAGYDKGHFSIGFDEPGKRELEVKLDGITISMGRETLAALGGKTLILKTIATGRPNPKSKRSSMLIAE